MRRLFPRTLWAAALGLALPVAAPAQQPMPPDQPAPPPAEQPAPPVADVPETPVPLPQAPVAPVAPVVVGDPYRAASPYNPTVVGRPVPNPQLNRVNYTLPCDIHNQNLGPLQLQPWNWGRGHGHCHGNGNGHFLHYTGNGNGCNNGCNNDCGNGGRAAGCGCLKGKLGHACCGDGGGACATCENTHSFIWGSSRTYFGESSREFFERPPAVDGIPNPHKTTKYPRATPEFPQ
jgi:hypothetical protein